MKDPNVFTSQFYPYSALLNSRPACSVFLASVICSYDAQGPRYAFDIPDGMTKDLGARDDLVVYVP